MDSLWIIWSGASSGLMPGLFKEKENKSSFRIFQRKLTQTCASHRSDAIYSAKYDGSGLIEVLRGHEYLSHPFAVTMYGGEVYWTDWRTNTLAKANKWTGSNVTVVQRTNTQPFDLQVYHPSRQPQGRNSHTLSLSTNTTKTTILMLTAWTYDGLFCPSLLPCSSQPMCS